MSDPLSQFAEEEDDIEKIIDDAASDIVDSNTEAPSQQENPDPPVEKNSGDDDDLFATDGETKQEGLERSQSQFSTASGDSELLAMIEDETEGAPKDLDVFVENPEKVVKTMESYVAFTVRTRTTRSDFENPEYSVKRRYNDFLWLQKQLAESYPYLISPPLPEKHHLTIDRFDREFIRFREVALHRFLNRVAQHPVTSADENLKTFLTLDCNEFQTIKKSSSGVLSRMSRSLSTLGGSFMLKNRPEEFTKLVEYANHLSSRMGALHRITERLHTERIDYVLALGGYPAAYKDWSQIEEELSGPLDKMSELLDTLKDQYKSLADESSLKVLLPLKEYSLYCDSLKDTLARRDATQHELEVVTEELVKVREEKEHTEGGQTGAVSSLLGRNTEEAQRAKLEKLSAKLTELEGAQEQCKVRVNETNRKFKTDVERWYHRKKQDIKEILGGIAQRNIDTYDKNISCLEETLVYMKGCLAGV